MPVRMANGPNILLHPHLPEILHDRVVWMVAASIVDMAARICYIEALTTATDEHLHLLLIEHSHLCMGMLDPSRICLEHLELGAVPSFSEDKGTGRDDWQHLLQP